MSKIILRGGVELENPLELVLEFLRPIRAMRPTTPRDWSHSTRADRKSCASTCVCGLELRYRAAASHRKEWRLAYRGLRLDRGYADCCSRLAERGGGLGGAPGV